MPVFKVIALTDVFNASGGSKIDTMIFNETVASDGAMNNHFVQVDRGNAVPSFIREADFNNNLALDLPVIPGQPIDDAFYVSECIAAERIFNADPSVPPAYVLADFVLARAIIETDLAPAGGQHPPSDAVGPLQVASPEWKRFIDNGGDLSEPFKNDPTAQLNLFSQIHAATWTMHDHCKGITGLKPANTGAGSNDPFVPSYLDLFHAYLTDSPAAAVAILDAVNADPTKTMAQVLAGKIPDGRIGKLFEGRKGFIGVAEPDNVGDFAAATAGVLKKALNDAFGKIKTNAPEEILVQTQGNAPWFAVAAAEEQVHVDANGPNFKDHILDYFKDTDHGRPTSIEPWCGAFVAFCLKHSGDPIAAASIPKGAAVAANWISWGASIPAQPGQIPQGAVIVLAPQPGTTGSIGHVGFFVEFTQNNQKVKLLGGNQSHKVTRTEFAASGIRAARWLDQPQAQGVAQFNFPHDIPADRKQFADLIVAKFAAAGFGKFQQITALANAIAESALNPMAHTMPEDSVGLFQLRRIKGIGGNHSVPELQGPAFNTELSLPRRRNFRHSPMRRPWRGP
jgi:uncharacterized protein (TIGR02594 family)